MANEELFLKVQEKGEQDGQRYVVLEDVSFCRLDSEKIAVAITCPKCKIILCGTMKIREV